MQCFSDKFNNKSGIEGATKLPHLSSPPPKKEEMSLMIK
jgi:hypothetical protein